jgi:hypothetical protein
MIASVIQMRSGSAFEPETAQATTKINKVKSVANLLMLSLSASIALHHERTEWKVGMFLCHDG